MENPNFDPVEGKFWAGFKFGWCEKAKVRLHYGSLMHAYAQKHTRACAHTGCHGIAKAKRGLQAMHRTLEQSNVFLKKGGEGAASRGIWSAAKVMQDGAAWEGTGHWRHRDKEAIAFIMVKGW